MARCIEQKRAQLHEQAKVCDLRAFCHTFTYANDVKQWDTLRTERTNALESTLESIGSQLVPDDFHSTADDSSIFGSPKSEANEDPIISTADRSPAATLRAQLDDKATDKSHWKTLRDFIDERAIEEILETVEIERAALDVGDTPTLPSPRDPCFLYVGCDFDHSRILSNFEHDEYRRQEFPASPWPLAAD